MARAPRDHIVRASSNPNRGRLRSAMTSTPLPPMDVRAIAEAGVVALRRGEFAKARAFFEQIVSAGRADAGICLGLARACLGLGDRAAAIAAVDKALSIEPRNL